MNGTFANLWTRLTGADRRPHPTLDTSVGAGPATDTPAALLAELSDHGIRVTSVWDLVNGQMDYQTAVPILLSWLSELDRQLPPGEKRESLREGLVRALSIRAAKGAAAPEMIRQFRLVGDDSIRWAIGNALSVVAEETTYGDMAELAVERRWGTARQMIVESLGRWKDLRAVPLLISLTDDDDVVAHAVIALGRQRDPKGRPALERLLHHSRPFVRKEAKKALARLRE